MKKFRVISFITSIAILCSIATVTTFAASGVYTAKTAYITGINANGTNLNNDLIDQNQNTIEDTALFVGQQGETLHIRFQLGGENVSITAEPSGTSENNNIVYYSSTCESSRYEVLTVNFEKQIEYSAKYFKSYYENHNEYKTMLKVYLKEITEDTQEKNFIMMEAFGFTLMSEEDTVAAHADNDMIDSWYGEEVLPISSKQADVPTLYDDPYDNPDDIERDIVQNYYYVGQTQTHTMRVQLYRDNQNVLAGQEASQQYRITIIGKSMRFDEAPNMNSSTASYLHIYGAALDFYSISNTAVDYIFIDGLVSKKSVFSGVLSASIGAGLGPFHFSFDALRFVKNFGKVKLNDTFRSFTNGVNNEFARKVTVSMDNSFKLTSVGDFFEANIVIRDYGNTWVDYEDLVAFWKLAILNFDKQETTVCLYMHETFICVQT